MTPEEFKNLKIRIIDKVMQSATVQVTNPSFEACTDPDNDIEEGECGICQRFHKRVYDECNRGEMIPDDKGTPTLLSEAMDMLIDELGGNLIEKLSLRKQR